MAQPPEPAMDFKESLFLILSALSSMILLGCLMVSHTPASSTSRPPNFSAPLWGTQEFFANFGCQVGIAWYFGARVDLFFKELDTMLGGSVRPSTEGGVPDAMPSLGRDEL